MTKKKDNTPIGITVIRTYTPDKEAMKRAIMIILRSSPKKQISGRRPDNIKTDAICWGHPATRAE